LKSECVDARDLITGYFVIDFDSIQREVVRVNIGEPLPLFLRDGLFQMVHRLCLIDINKKASSISNEEAPNGVRHLAKGGQKR
jgi:hypothetical protein